MLEEPLFFFVDKLISLSKLKFLQYKLPESSRSKLNLVFSLAFFQSCHLVPHRSFGIIIHRIGAILWVPL
jgi:hypothetical protein